MPKPTHKTYVPMNIMIDPELRFRLDAMSALSRRSKRDIVLTAIRAELDNLEAQAEHGEVLGAGM